MKRLVGVRALAASVILPVASAAWPAFAQTEPKELPEAAVLSELQAISKPIC